MKKNESSGEFEVDIREKGSPRSGEFLVLDERLFMQLLVYRCRSSMRIEEAVTAIADGLAQGNMGGVIYYDANDPLSLGVLSWTQEPSKFVTVLHPVFRQGHCKTFELRSDITMLGRTYSSGFEPDLAWWLLDRPRETALRPECPWAVWYPLRRTGAFAQLDAKEQGLILREHAQIGRAYGDKDLVHDIRLACHGLDANDNEFVIGLVGKDLHPLSHIIQTMRRTRQTSEFIQKMGPFFVGHVARRCPER